MKKFIKTITALAVTSMFIFSCASSGTVSVPTSPDSSATSTGTSEAAAASTTGTSNTTASSASAAAPSSNTAPAAATSSTGSSSGAASAPQTSASSAFTSSNYSGQYNAQPTDTADASDGEITDSAYATVAEHIAAGRIKDNHGQYVKYSNRYGSAKFWMFKYQNGKWKDVKNQ
jgi:hypothetical protein